MSISPHGLVFALLQFGFVLGLLWLHGQWGQRRRAMGRRDDFTVPGILMLALVVEYALLRWQPIRMGGDPFAYTLGLFDAFTFAGLVFLPILHAARRRTPAGR